MFLTVSGTILYLFVSSVGAQSNCGVPGAVKNLKAEDTTNISTHLSWEPPASTECLDHYKITYCSYLNNTCSNKTVVLSLNTTQYVVTGLQPCSSSLIQVYTVGKDGGETNTGLLLYTGSGDPPKVDQVNASYVGASNVTLDWKRPIGYSDQCYPGFKVCFSSKGHSKQDCFYSMYDYFTTKSSVHLSPCTEYNFSVATVDGNFASNSKTSANTYVSVFTAPQMPNVTVELHNHTAHATWHAPDALSMTCAASYTVEHCRRVEESDPFVCKTLSSQKLPLTTTEATITGLKSCTNNHIFFNLTGHNGHSSSIEVIVQDPDSEIPTPTDVIVEDERSYLLVYYSDSLADCVDSYRLCWFTGSESETCRNVTFGDVGIIQNPHLHPNSNYTLVVTALGSEGRSSKNFTTSFLTGSQELVNLSVLENPIVVTKKVVRDISPRSSNTPIRTKLRAP